MNKSTIPDPFKKLSNSVLRPALILFLFLSLMLLSAMSLLDKNLKTAAAPRGIVSFELAGDLEQGNRILASWQMKGKIRAALSLGLDYLFLIVYALFISLACVLIGRRSAPKYRLWAYWGFILGWGQLLAALLDAIENFALIRVILDSPRDAWPIIARWCAIVKFSIVGAGLAYILIGVIYAGLRRVIVSFKF